MKATERIVLELIVLAALLALLGLVLTQPQALAVTRDAVSSGLTMVASFFDSIIGTVNDPWRLLLILVLWMVGYYIYSASGKWNEEVGSKISGLKSAAIDLVRLMETTADGVEKKHKILNETYEKFAVDGLAKIIGAHAGPVTTRQGNTEDDPPPTPSARWQASTTITLPPELIPLHTENAWKLRQARADDMGAFSGTNMAVRQGLATFLLIVEHGYLSAAYDTMIEHMKKQRDDAKKVLPPYHALKRVLGLPTTWPQGTEPEDLHAKGLDAHHEKLIEEALKRGKDDIMKTLQDWGYNLPVPDKDPKPVARMSGARVLKAMRTFLRSLDTYDKDLLDQTIEEEKEKARHRRSIIEVALLVLAGAAATAAYLYWSGVIKL